MLKDNIQRMTADDDLIEGELFKKRLEASHDFLAGDRLKGPRMPDRHGDLRLNGKDDGMGGEAAEEGTDDVEVLEQATAEAVVEHDWIRSRRRRRRRRWRTSDVVRGVAVAEDTKAAGKGEVEVDRIGGQGKKEVEEQGPHRDVHGCRGER